MQIPRLSSGMWAKFNRNVEAIQPSAAILPQLKVEIQRELSKLEFSPRLQAAERKLQALTDRCNNWPDPASIMSQLKVGMKQELANFESGPKLRSMEQSLQTRNDECRELAEPQAFIQLMARVCLVYPESGPFDEPRVGKQRQI